MSDWICPDCESGKKPDEELHEEKTVEQPVAAEENPIAIPDSVYGDADSQVEQTKVADEKKPVKKPKVHPLFLKLDPGYFRPIDPIWDGSPEHIPEDWKGRWVIVENDGCIDYKHQLHVNQVDTCYLKNGRGGIAIIATPFSSFKDTLRPGLFSNRAAAEKAVVNSFLEGERSHWWGVNVDHRNPLKTTRCVRDCWANGREKTYSYPWFMVMRIEDVRLRKRADIRREMRELWDKERGLLQPDHNPVNVTVSNPGPDGSSTGHTKPGMTDYADYLIRQHDNLEKGITYTPYRREDEAKPKEDWSKVDWAAEARESAMKEYAYRESVRKGNPRVATVWWVLKDWNTDGYLRLPNKSKGEEGDGWLEDDIKKCTCFKSVEEANGVATAIERLFWKPVYSKMNLHVCPLKDELPTID